MTLRPDPPDAPIPPGAHVAEAAPGTCLKTAAEVCMESAMFRCVYIAGVFQLEDGTYVATSGMVGGHDHPSACRAMIEDLRRRADHMEVRMELRREGQEEES